MAQRRFDISKIRISNNPFTSLGSRGAISVEDGVFIKDIDIIDNKRFVISPQTKSAVKVGMIREIEDIFNGIVETSEPKHVIIFADWGQGKSFSIKYIQDTIYSKYIDPIISISIGSRADIIISEKDKFTKNLLQCLYTAFDNLDSEIFPDKERLKIDYKVEELGNSTSYKNALRNFDNIFSLLNVRVYIFIDEIEKILIEPYEDSVKRNFVAELKTIAECESSISLWIAGTTTCQDKINSLGVDYGDRLKPIYYNFFNKTDTIEYINKKSQDVLGYIGYIPYMNAVKEEIWKYSGGNIRFIEDLCWNLWNFSYDNRARIDINLWKKYLSKELVEPTKTVLGSRIDSHIIDFIIQLILNDKVGSYSAFKGLSDRKKREIKRYIEDNQEVIIRIGRSYKLNSDIKTQILKKKYREIMI